MIATASPEIGTGAELDAAPEDAVVAAAVDVAADEADKPKFGSPEASVFAAAPVFSDPETALLEEDAATSVERTLA